MYTLIGSPKSRAFRVMWMMEELDQPYEQVSAGPRSPEAMAVNPSGKVPVLVVEGEVVIDSAAICQFLADNHGALTFKAGTIERAKQDSWLHFVLDEMDAALWFATKNTFVFPEELRSDKAIEACAGDFASALGLLEKRLGDSTFMMGDTFTVPDVIATHCLGWAIGMFSWPVPDGIVSEYMKRTRARSAFKKAWAIREAA